MPDGNRFRFTENLDGVTYVPPPGRKDILVRNGVSGPWTLTLQQSRSRYEFDATGALTAMKDDYGNTLNVTYISGRVDRITDAVSGRYVSVTYGANGRIHLVTDFTGRQVEHGFSGAKLTTVTDPADRSTTYSYHPSRFVDLLTQIRDPWNRVVADVTYTSTTGRVETYTELGETFTLTYRYGDVPNRTAKEDSEGNVTVFDFAPSGQVTSRGIEGTPVAQTTYTPDGFVELSTDEVGVKTFYTYNLNGTVATLTRDYQGSKAVRFDYTYDPNFPAKPISIVPKNPTTGVRDPNWQEWRYDYYQSGAPAPGAINHVYRVRENGTTLDTLSTYEYNTRGQVTKHTSAIGGVTDYAYDAQGNLISVTAPSNNDTGTRPITGYTPDALGRVLTMTDPLGFATTYTYDELDRVETITLPRPTPSFPSSFTTTIAYDNFDAGTSLLYVDTTDANGILTRQGYDQYGRLARTVDAATATTIYTYDRDRLDTIVDPLNNVTGYDYDSLGRLQTVTFPNADTESYTYWPDGLLHQRTDRKGQVVTFTYDAHKRLYQRSGTGTITYNYTGQKLTSVVDSTVSPSETHSYGYDTSYRVNSDTQGPRGTLTYTYFADDQIKNRTITGGPLPISAAYRYYPDGTLDRIGWSQTTGEFKYTYNLRGQYESILFPSGQGRGYEYDDQGRLTRIINDSPAQGNVATYEYGYDLNHATGQLDRKGQRVSVTATLGTFGAPATTTYRYDTNGQLTTATYPTTKAPFTETHTFTYDPIGNRLTSSVTGQPTNTYTYQQIGGHNWQRLATEGGNTYTYDDNGNTLTRTGSAGNITATWNDDDRMTSLTVGGVTTTFADDYKGRRTTKTVGGSTTTFLYDGDDLIRESGTTQVDYLFGPGIDEPLAMRLGANVHYFAVDGLGSVTALVTSNHSIANTYDYDAWGVLRAKTGSVTNPFEYTARESAGELMFYRARYYSPAIGRFLSEDPLGYGPQPSLYAYVQNSPPNDTDPSGLESR
jgi:RHS repeat-associated protein